MIGGGRIISNTSRLSSGIKSKMSPVIDRTIQWFDSLESRKAEEIARKKG